MHRTVSSLVLAGLFCLSCVGDEKASSEPQLEAESTTFQSKSTWETPRKYEDSVFYEPLPKGLSTWVEPSAYDDATIILSDAEFAKIDESDVGRFLPQGCEFPSRLSGNQAVFLLRGVMVEPASGSDAVLYRDRLEVLVAGERVQVVNFAYRRDPDYGTVNFPVMAVLDFTPVAVASFANAAIIGGIQDR